MKLVVIEDHRMVRDFVIATCSQIPGVSRVEGALDGRSGIELCREFEPDLVVLDIVLPDIDGFAVARTVRALDPDVAILGLSANTDPVTLLRVIESDFQGFIDKNDNPPSAIEQAVVAIRDGHVYFSRVIQAVREVRRGPHAFHKLLSEREQELLAYLGAGLSNDEVAARLPISTTTVQSHRRNIMAKLGLHSRSELMRYALQQGFTRIPPLQVR